MKRSVAIDGPSGAGKSTLAKSVSKRFGFVYVDTGAIYRAVGLYVRQKGVHSKDAPAVEKLLPEIKIDIEYDSDGNQHILLNGEDVSGKIREPEISIYASDVSAMPAVRAFLLDMQRSLAERYDVVMDGRDIGTVVLPKASVKIFLTASQEERARRRHKELTEKGIACTYEEVLRDMQYRDKNDSSREIAPLKPAADSILLDTTELGFEESADRIAQIISERLGI
ncbi:MAG TPA: (d)CMP kinase [Clostridiales bacterium]|jgi:cytidylate kinase|nr:(d)CMP kinase [Clostridiales bacterium]